MEPLFLEIPDELFAPAESSHFEGIYELPVLKAGPDLYSFVEPLAWQVDVSNTGDALLVTGTVEGAAATSCCRCLEAVNLSLIGEVEGYFLIGEQGSPEDMAEDEFDVLPEDGKVDLGALIVAALLLEVPMVPLCDDECKGICLDCGANLNEGGCSCASEPLEEEDPACAGNPFAALKGLKLD